MILLASLERRHALLLDIPVFETPFKKQMTQGKDLESEFFYKEWQIFHKDTQEPRAEVVLRRRSLNYIVSRDRT
jgi:hypothetical protein